MGMDREMGMGRGKGWAYRGIYPVRALWCMGLRHRRRRESSEPGDDVSRGAVPGGVYIII